MLSSQEQEYVRSIINTYSKNGYSYYLCCTNRDTSVGTDIYLYFSKQEIKAINDTCFSIIDGIQVNIDTSYRYNDSPDVLKMYSSISGNMVVISKKEYVYSNCVYEYTVTSEIIYPDILLSGNDSFNSIYIVNFLLISIFLYLFIKSILRIRR